MPPAGPAADVPGGHPLPNDPANPETPTPAAPAATPPWGADFDAERAWTLLQNVRADLTAEKAKVATLTTERDDAVTARDAKEAELVTVRADLDTAARGAILARIVGKYPTLAGFEDLLSGATEEEVETSAKRLTSIATPATPAEPAAPAEPVTPEPDPALPPRPEPALTPGYTAEQPPAPTDLDAIVAAARKSR